jgi:HD-GYP domain-containing protein (c-di-GMP phosphodiesterase class II)
VAELLAGAGTHYDPEVAAAIVAVLEHERRGDEAKAS